MTPERIVPWIVGVCTGLLGSQRKPLSQLVFGAMRCRRVSQADIGRSMAGQALVKHRIKQVARFVSNPEVEIAAGAHGLMAIVAKAAGWQLPVALDWVDVRDHKVLRAAVPLRGRSVPVLFAAYPKWDLFHSQNAFEEGFLTLLKTLVLEGTHAAQEAAGQPLVHRPRDAGGSHRISHPSSPPTGPRAPRNTEGKLGMTQALFGLTF